jgi:hypothetical protein
MDMLKSILGVAALVACAGTASVASAQPVVPMARAAGIAVAAQWRPGRDWDRDITVSCGSPQYSYAFCQVDTGRGSRVYLRNQKSDTRCVEGRNWGWNRGGIWVDKGCSGTFVVERRWNDGPGPGPGPGPDDGWRPGPGWDRDIRITCGSPQYNYAFCQVDTGRGSSVVLERQTSDARCVEGRTWGWNRGGVWVDKGCSGVFVVQRRWR